MKYWVLHANKVKVPGCNVNNAMDSCTKATRKYKKREKKEIFCFVKWEHYQPEYLWKYPKKSTRKSRCTNTQKNDAHVADIGEERRIEEKRIKENGKNENHPTDLSHNSPLLSTPTKKEEFLLMLKEYKGYPYDEAKDSLLFDVSVQEYPKINILEQTRRKISWWHDHPDALKAGPRSQLQEFFKEEDKFQKQGGPQPIGDVIKELTDPDHRNWAKEFIKPATR